MWHLTVCKISVSLSFLNWIKNEMIFYRFSELILPAHDYINTIHQFIKPFLDKKMSIFDKYGAFKYRIIIKKEIILKGQKLLLIAKWPYSAFYIFQTVAFFAWRFTQKE